MATYEEIYGKRVKDFDSDPTLDSSYEGQVWYDKSSGTNKALVQIKAFSSGGNYPAGFYGTVGGAGTQTAGITFGGRTSPTANYDKSNEYNGFGWTATPDLGTGRYGIAGCGTQTAALGAGGYRYPDPPTGPRTETEEWDGSSWTAGGALPTGVNNASMSGTQTAALFSGGNSSRTEVLNYNGSTWTSEPALNVGRRSLRGAGTTTDAIVFGGFNPSTPLIYSNTESFNGSTWTEVSNMNTAIYDMNAMGSSSSHVASNSGNNGSNTNSTEEWDGTNWTTAPTSSVTHRGGAGFGTANAGVSAVGGSSPYTAVEEYNSNINAIVKSSWASGGNMSSVRAQHGSANAGTQDSGLAIGGYVFQTSSNTDSCEEYGGSSWTSGGDLPTTTRQKGASGTQTATIAFGGFPSPGPGTESLNYNGSSWTSAPALNTGAVYAFGNGGGTSTAALRAGSGNPGGYTTTTEEYDGSSWTSGGALNSGMTSGAVDGSLTAGIVCGGEGDPSSPLTTSGVTSQTEEYNGSAWATGNPIVLRISSQGKSGGTSAQTAWMIAGGDGPTVTNNTGTTQLYDGTNWSTSAPLSTPRRQVAGGGTQASGLVFGGTEASSTSLNSTEEFTNGSETVTARTLTTS
jgi:hypothetical protein